VEVAENPVISERCSCILDVVLLLPVVRRLWWCCVVFIITTGWLIKSGPFHFVAYNVYTMQILNISVGQRIYTVVKTFIKMLFSVSTLCCKNWSQSFPKLSDCAVSEICRPSMLAVNEARQPSAMSPTLYLSLRHISLSTKMKKKGRILAKKRVLLISLACRGGFKGKVWRGEARPPPKASSTGLNPAK